jgi:hypothetical protein
MNPGIASAPLRLVWKANAGRRECDARRVVR